MLDTPAERALRHLEKHTGFGRDVRRIIQRAIAWPQRWMTAEEIEWELRLRDFWSRGRQAVHPDARVGLVRLYLAQQVAPAGNLDSAVGWVGEDGRYRYRASLVHRRARSSAAGGAAAAAGGRGDRRGRRRVETAFLQCQFGDVVDLSLSGAKVIAPASPPLTVDQRIRLNLAWRDEPAMPLRARVVWINHGDSGWTIGIEFRTPSPEQKSWLRDTIRRTTALMGAGGEAVK